MIRKPNPYQKWQHFTETKWLSYQQKYEKITVGVICNHIWADIMALCFTFQEMGTFLRSIVCNTQMRFLEFKIWKLIMVSQGLWIGMLCGIITETLALSFMMWRTNWDEEVFLPFTRKLCLNIRIQN